jgi:hypothetical protein
VVPDVTATGTYALSADAVGLTSAFHACVYTSSPVSDGWSHASSMYPGFSVAAKFAGAGTCAGSTGPVGPPSVGGPPPSSNTSWTFVSAPPLSYVGST